MPTVAVTRRSFLRHCELVEDSEASTIYTYWDLFEPPDIVAQDDDIQYYVAAGDRPDSLSVKFYGTPHLWWVIAQVNDLDSPVTGLYKGRLLTIPNPRYILETVSR